MPSTSKAKKCPLCGNAETSEFTPFCSRGCRDRDLLRWLGGGYRIPGPKADPEEVLGRVDSDDGDS
ncbi:MAG: DNA gyrase inhibitor YacG [Pseudomonadota bacterium]